MAELKNDFRVILSRSTAHYIETLKMKAGLRDDSGLPIMLSLDSLFGVPTVYTNEFVTHEVAVVGSRSRMGELREICRDIEMIDGELRALPLFFEGDVSTLDADPELVSKLLDDPEKTDKEFMDERDALKMAIASMPKSPREVLEDVKEAMVGPAEPSLAMERKPEKGEPVFVRDDTGKVTADTITIERYISSDGLVHTVCDKMGVTYECELAKAILPADIEVGAWVQTFAPKKSLEATLIRVMEENDLLRGQIERNEGPAVKAIREQLLEVMKDRETLLDILERVPFKSVPVMDRSEIDDIRERVDRDESLKGAIGPDPDDDDDRSMMDKFTDAALGIPFDAKASEEDLEDLIDDFGRKEKIRETLAGLGPAGEALRGFGKAAEGAFDALASTTTSTPKPAPVDETPKGFSDEPGRPSDKGKPVKKREISCSNAEGVRMRLMIYHFPKVEKWEAWVYKTRDFGGRMMRTEVKPLVAKSVSDAIIELREMGFREL